MSSITSGLFPVSRAVVSVVRLDGGAPWERVCAPLVRDPFRFPFVPRLGGILGVRTQINVVQYVFLCAQTLLAREIRISVDIQCLAPREKGD